MTVPLSLLIPGLLLVYLWTWLNHDHRLVNRGLFRAALALLPLALVALGAGAVCELLASEEPEIRRDELLVTAGKVVYGATFFLAAVSLILFVSALLHRRASAKHPGGATRSHGGVTAALSNTARIKRRKEVRSSRDRAPASEALEALEPGPQEEKGEG